MTRLLGLIPARSGSVRLPSKNLLEIDGASLIARTVGAALDSTLLDEIALSTDSDAYANSAANAGLDTAYRRPAHLNEPETTTIDAVLDCLKWRNEQGLAPVSHVLILQPTSPQRCSQDIDRAIAFWRASGKASLISVMPVGPSAGYVVIENRETGELSGGGDAINGNVFILDGMFFLASVDMLADEQVFWNAESALYVNTYPRPHDIDTQSDFAAARCMIEAGTFAVSSEPAATRQK